MFQYESCGLDYVFLKNGYHVIDTPYGETTCIEGVVALAKVSGRANAVPWLKALLAKTPRVPSGQ